jgi:hypothetical protein
MYDTLETGSGAGDAQSCVPCGALGDLCCEGSQCNGDNLLCGGMFCEACGAIDQQCCGGNTCPNALAVCMEGTCAALPAAPAMGWTVLLTLVGVLVGVGSLGLGLRTRGN